MNKNPCTDQLPENKTEEIPGERILNDMAEFYKVFGDITRLRILYALAQSELCVQEITGYLGIGQSAISHQLRILKQSRLVKYKRRGKQIYYSLDDSHVGKIIEQGYEHITE